MEALAKKATKQAKQTVEGALKKAPAPAAKASKKDEEELNPFVNTTPKGNKKGSSLTHRIMLVFAQSKSE